MKTQMKTHLKRVAHSPATMALIVINILVYVSQLLSPDITDHLLLRSGWTTFTERPWTLLSVMVLHDNVFHLGLMIGLLIIFGVVLEQIVTARRIALIYVVSGLVGAVAIVLVARAIGHDVPAVGASAAIHGIVGALVAIRPGGSVPGGTTQQWVMAFIVTNLALLFALPLGSVAHLSGLATGFLYGHWLTTRNPEAVGVEHESTWSRYVSLRR